MSGEGILKQHEDCEGIMKDRLVKKFCVFFLAACTAGVLASGCARERTDSLSELELEQEKGDAEEASEDAVQREDPGTVFVYVCGAVNAPGVYELAGDARVYEAIALAGGLNDAAAGEALNQASTVTDGERIYIPTAEELEKGIVDGQTAQVTGTDNQGKININTAAKEELKTLPGIGDAKADSIISYREANGGFQTVEELMQVEGIKEGVFNKIKDRVVS